MSIWSASKPRIWGMSLLVGLLLAGLAQVYVRLLEDRARQEQRSDVSTKGLVLASKLESLLSADVFLANGLAAFVTVLPEVQESSIPQALKTVYNSGVYLRNIGVAPGNRISHVYPLEGNQAALGLYYPEVPAQWPAVKAAIESKTTQVAGPVPLKQGGMGLISRTPVFLDDGQYWGMLSLVMDSEAMLSEVARVADGVGLRFALRGKDGKGPRGEVFYGDEALFASGALTLPIQVPGGTWLMAVQPQGDSAAHAPLWWRLAGLAVGLLGGWAFLLYAISRHQVDQSVRRLQAYLSTAPDAVVVTNPEGCITEFNAAAERTFGYSADEIMGQPISRLFSVDAVDVPYILSPVSATAGSGGAVSVRSVVGRKKDGGTVALELTLGVTEFDGQAIRIVVVRDVTERLGFERKLQDMAMRDTLTQVLNRRTILDEVHTAWKEAQFSRSALAVVTVDVSGLTTINARWGTQTGDYVLVRLAQLLSEQASGVGLVGRWGGDEFLVILHGKTQAQAQAWAQEVQKAVTAATWETQEGQPLVVAVDVGEAAVGPTTVSVKDLLQKAGESMRHPSRF